MNDKETLEEAAMKMYPIKTDPSGYDINMFSRYGFYNGAKWQAERMYSKEEVGELLYNAIGEYGKHYGVMINGKMLNDLFEQFKKK